ncbi:hypothetical protein [Flavobacterium lindanitolerans]|uniref:Uncharacterized protein n=1 Tax=Flavobacterium lindanitolerans TaxID=428988 RepID=A0A497V0N6_9FLAO|nr:hypothetical protein [Flavobacterium lindanitolerans]MBC8643549.1 hypothetical protein [Flavobacterium lindanitolerans]PKW28759.1 hypothetical protein B0G92_0385 [Flavobacterium lindanitolerans]RLJ35737.1 hypothetical protein CLV50_1120 [Flavobacterium lindanitolerans]
MNKYSLEISSNPYSFSELNIFIQDAYNDIVANTSIEVNCWWDSGNNNLKQLLISFGIVMSNGPIYIVNGAEKILKTACKETPILAICHLAGLIILAKNSKANISCQTENDKVTVWIEF